MRILIVEDDPILAHGLKKAFESDYVVDSCSRVADAIEFVQETDYDTLILDLGLLDGDGKEVLKFARHHAPLTPVLILTARDSLDDRVAGLNLGADDYVTKPFELPELEARVRALVRRKYLATTSEVTIGNMKFDSVGKRVFVNGKPVELSARETSLLELLILNAGRIVTKERILEKIGGDDAELGLNAIEVYMHRLRKKIEGEGFLFRTVRGLGYLLQPELREA